MARGWKMKNLIQQKLQELSDSISTVSPEDMAEIEEARRSRERLDAVAAETESMLDTAEQHMRELNKNITETQKIIEGLDDDIMITSEMISDDIKKRTKEIATPPDSDTSIFPEAEIEIFFPPIFPPPDDGYYGNPQDEFVPPPPDDRQDWDNDPNFQEWMQAQANMPHDIDESMIPPPEMDERYQHFDEEDLSWRMDDRAVASAPPFPPNDPPKRNYGFQNDVQMPDDPKKPTPPKPSKPKDDDIMIDADMLEEKPTRQLYTVKEEFLEEVLRKAFDRLDLPAINYINGSDILIETGGDAPADLIVVKPDGGELKVPLGEHEQTKLDDSMAEFEQMKGLDKK